MDNDCLHKHLKDTKGLKLAFINSIEVNEQLLLLPLNSNILKNFSSPKTRESIIERLKSLIKNSDNRIISEMEINDWINNESRVLFLINNNNDYCKGVIGFEIEKSSKKIFNLLLSDEKDYNKEFIKSINALINWSEKSLYLDQIIYKKINNIRQEEILLKNDFVKSKDDSNILT